MKKLLLIAIITMTFNLLVSAQTTPDAFQKLTKLRAQIENLLRDGHREQSLKVVEGITDKEALEQPDFYNIKALVHLNFNDFAKADENYQMAFDKMLTSVEIDMLSCTGFTEVLEMDILLSPEVTIWKYESLIKLNQRRQNDYKSRNMLKNLEPLNLKGTDNLSKLKEDVLFCSAKSYLSDKSLKVAANSNPTATALENINIVLKLNPNRADAYKVRAKIYRKLGKKDLAEADEKKVK